MTVVCPGLGEPHAGWTAVDELAGLVAHYFGAQVVAPAPAGDSLLRRLAGRGRIRFMPQAHDCGDVLFVVARGPQDLAVLDAFPDVRRRHSRIHAFITDSYFEAGYGRQTALCDAICVTAREDAVLPATRFGVAVHHVWQGIDALRWAPVREAARDVDVLAFGRTPPSYHAALQNRFHGAGSPHLYLHSPLGTLAGPTVHLERGMLMKLLHRAKVSLAFHMYVEPQGTRPRSMMVTSRWLESLLSGCIVAGRRPVSAMAEGMLAWDGATVELPDEPQDACDAIEDLLAAHEALRAQRCRNIAEVALRHDWRWRIAQMADAFGWGRPRALIDDLARVQSLAAFWQPALLSASHAGTAVAG